jgi:hypothetical protein
VAVAGPLYEAPLIPGVVAVTPSPMGVTNVSAWCCVECRENFEGEKYRTFADFIADARLIFTNAMTYNAADAGKPGSESAP